MSHRPRRQDTQAANASTAPPQAAAQPAPAFFLRTKLLPPRPAPALLPRPRLIERLATNLVHPVTLVAANAGSGKTTLVADFVRTQARPFVWYQLDHTDADPFVFLGYLANGLRQHAPEFGAATLAYLQQAAAEVAQQPERAVDVLLNEVLDLVEQPMIIVLDDYHHLGAETPVHAVVDRLLAYLPDVLHVIIISRDVPAISLSRLRAQNALTIIDRAELLFTDDETQQLFRQVFDLELTPAQLAEYRERTHGWITALQLVRQVAQRQALARGANAGAPDLVEILRQSERDIFDYFAEEVFADEPGEVQEFLLRIALLERVETDVCGRLFSAANCAALLPALVRRNVFITVASDGRGEEYRLHPLFRDFLRRRLHAEIGQAGVAAEHARCAGYFIERGRWEPAVRHLLAAEDFARAAEVVAAKGEEWLATGAFSALVSFVAALPEAVTRDHPRALAHRAEVARLRGEYDAAQTLFRRAAALMNEQGDTEGEAEALHSLATIARRRGDYQTAFAYLDRAVELTDEHSPVRVKCGNTRGLCLVYMKQRAEGERVFREALQAAEALHDEHYARLIAHNLGLPAMVRGDFGEALRWLRHMLPADDHAPPTPQEATAHLNMARCYLWRGDFASCERHLERAMTCCQLFNMGADVGGAVLETYGDLYLERADAARAAEFYDLAVRAYEQAGLDVWRFEVREAQALLHLQVGDLLGARALLDHLIEQRVAAGDDEGTQTARLARGRVMLAQGDTAAATAELEPVLHYFHAQGLYYYEAQACTALAAARQQTGDEPQMLAHLRRALDLAARYDYEHWLQRELERNPALFRTPQALELLPPDLREQVPAAQAQAAAPVAVAPGAPPKPAADLTIKMLGPVEIYRDPARPLAADAWTTKRARDILCFIASRRHRRASKDTIIDTFWGEADFDAVEKNFHPTVSHIRKALNSRQPLKQNFLLYRDGDYLLSQDFAYSIDTEEFDRLVAEADAARRAGKHDRQIELYEQACALYRGDFMQGTYDEWVEEQRAYYREQYLRMLEALAVAAQKQEDWPRTLQLAQEILRDDQFREDVHCMLMRAHGALGNRGAIKEQYDALRRLLRKELGVEPAAETQRLYKQLMA
ncbi:MAG TPA: BTAD domain-containing putative transcriptional regulator [Pyrinomonadaceae bacterium]|jgi:LuxR family maltose regulon positive regulatory protein